MRPTQELPVEAFPEASGKLANKEKKVIEDELLQ